VTRHVYRCPLRWFDLDVYGIVNNVVFLRYLEEARVDFIFRMAPTEGDAFFRDGSVVVRHEIAYKNRLTHRHEPVDIEMWVSRLESATVTIDYEVKDSQAAGGTLYAVASTTMAPFNYATGRPRRLTDEETAFFEKFLDETAAV
jgi:acyl-CoA thioester hydrolase